MVLIMMNVLLSHMVNVKLSIYLSVYERRTKIIELYVLGLLSNIRRRS